MKSFREYLAEFDRSPVQPPAGADVVDTTQYSNTGDNSSFGLGGLYHGWGYCPADRVIRAQEFAKAMNVPWESLGATIKGASSTLKTRFNHTNTVPTKLLYNHSTKTYKSDGAPQVVELPIPTNLYSGAERQLLQKSPEGEQWNGFGFDDPTGDPGVGCEGGAPLGAKHPLRGNSFVAGSRKQSSVQSRSDKSDPKVKELQDRILAKDPTALPKFGADGQMGPETRGAMARLGIKESLELQRILDIAKF